MRKRLISVCIVAILICSIYGCAKTAEDAPTAEPETVETDYTEIESEEEADAVDAENDILADDKEIAAVCEKVKAMDFTANQPQMDIDPKENQLYLEVYLKILKNEMPIINTVGEEMYYKDLWRSGIEFEELLENKDKREYYYDDLDGDGKPELAIEQGCMYIFDYVREKDESRILYDEQACYFKKIVGAGQIWYHDGLHASVIRDRLIVLNEDNEWEWLLDIEQGTDPKSPYYIVFTDDGTVNVGEENWNEITEPFFEMVKNNGLPLKTLEEVFGELLAENNVSDESDTIYLKPCNTYQDILDNAYEVIVAGRGADIIASDEVFSFYGIREALYGRDTEEALAGIGYMFYDVDGNGIEELIIADMLYDDGGSWDNRILLMYSLADNKPVLLIDGWARNRYYLLNDNTIYHAGSGGAAYSVFANFRVAEDGISLEVIDYYSSGYYGDSEWGWFHSTTGEMTEDESELIEFEDEDVLWDMQDDYMAQVKELDLTFFEDYVAEPGSEKESYIDTEQVISDFLSMDSGEFQNKYNRDNLYQSGILYCGLDAWKYNGSMLSAFQEKYYDVENVSAIRFYKKRSVPVYLDMNINDQSGQYEEEISIDYHTDYAVSVYSKPADDGLSCIQEISFVKIELSSGEAPEDLYDSIETGYYKVMEELDGATWILSSDGEKAAYVSNGMIPMHPSQIFIRYKEDKPYTVFREYGAREIAGWVDDDHLVYYHHDYYPVLMHLERNETEEVPRENCDYDAYGVKYYIQGDNLIAQPYYEEPYQWQIQEKDGEIYIVEPD